MWLPHIILSSQTSDQHKAVADTKLATMDWQLCAGTASSASSELKYHANTASREQQMTKETEQLLNIALRLRSHFSSNSFFLPAII